MKKCLNFVAILLAVVTGIALSPLIALSLPLIIHGGKLHG